LKGKTAVGEFLLCCPDFVVRQQADTGTKMITLGKNTKSTIHTKAYFPQARVTIVTVVLSEMNPGAMVHVTLLQCGLVVIGDQCWRSLLSYVRKS